MRANTGIPASSRKCLDPSVTLPSADEIFLDGFESGDLSGWNSAETDSGDLSATTSAVLYGSYGLSALVDDATPLFVQDNSPIHEPHYRARFYFDPNSIAIPAGYSLRLFEGRDLTAGTVLRIDLRYSDDEYQVEATILDDSQTSTDTGWTAVTDAPHALEVEWLAAWDSENADGGLIFWVDGEESGYIPWIDNDTHRVDTVRLGAPAVGSASTSGTLYLDDFVSHKSEYIGLNEQQRSTMQEAGVRTLPASPARSQALRLPSRSARTPAVQTLEASSGEVSRTIDYTYDGLHRLTNADYDNGDYYAYSYDAVGNRLVLDSDVNGNPVYLEYTYDNANRLATAGEVEYEWDDNGNLLDDGVNTYAYNSANRLLTVSGESLAASYGYNGLGERLEQTVNSQATEFVMDLNGGLSQVLDDGTNTYTYGLGRLSQVNGSGAEYYLGDALGSVRQLTDATGAVTLARSYEPYGSVEQEAAFPSVGTDYGFTGEFADPNTNLIYLRARYMNPYLGRFMTRDTWEGSPNQPMSYNSWEYGNGNPGNLTDPTGYSSIGGGTGLADSLICFGFHSLGHGSLTGISAFEAVNTCKRAYSWSSWSRSSFNFDTNLPKSAHDLVGWWLFEYGNSHIAFDANEPLTREIAKSKLVFNKRLEFYLIGDITGEYKFNLPEQVQCVFDFYTNLSLPLSCILGSFSYQIKSINNNWVGFRVDNRTDLESGTHIAGRFPDAGYKGSVEDLIDRGVISGSEPLDVVLNTAYLGNDNRKVISILKFKNTRRDRLLSWCKSGRYDAWRRRIDPNICLE